MASIPLPALDVKPVQQPDMLEALGRVQQLKNMGVQSQIQQQQLQQQQIATQQAQAGQKDQDAFRTAMSDPSMQGKTMGEIADTLARMGRISPQGYIGAKKADVEQRKLLSDLNEKDLTNLKTGHDVTQQLYNNVMNLPDEQLAANWPQIAQQYNQIPGNSKMPMDPQKPMSKQELSQFGPLMSLRNSYLDEEMKRRQATAQTSTAESEATIKGNEAQFGNNSMAEAKYRWVLQRMQQKLPVSDNDMAAARAYEASQAKNTTTSDSLGVTSTNSSRPAGLSAMGAHPAAAPGGGSAPATGTPAANASNTKNSLVDMIGQYRYDPAQISRLVAKHPELIAAVGAKYPDFDATNYPAKAKLMQGYTSGTQSKEINAINTAMGHVKALDDAVDALHNGDATLLNKLGTMYNINVAGKTPEAAFKLIVNRVGPEIAAAYIPGGGGEHERIANQNDFDVNLPPQTLHNNAAVTVELLRSKIGALENQYKQQVGRDDFSQRFITPQAQASLQKFSGKGAGNGGGGFTITAPNGKTYNFKSQADLDNFKTKAGLK